MEPNRLNNPPNQAINYILQQISPIFVHHVQDDWEPVDLNEVKTTRLYTLTWHKPLYQIGAYRGYRRPIRPNILPYNINNVKR